MTMGHGGILGAFRTLFDVSPAQTSYPKQNLSTPLMGKPKYRPVHALSFPFGLFQPVQIFLNFHTPIQPIPFLLVLCSQFIQ